MTDIYSKINELFDDFENQRLYKKFKSAEEQLKANKEIMNLINNIKKLQKKITNTGNENIEKDLKVLYDKLNSYPLYQSYLILKEEVEYELKFISDTFSEYFNKILKL